MTHCGVAIGANLMFVLFSLPVITTGAAWTALEYTMLRAERGDGVINPFKEFWKGFKATWKQSTITGFLAAALWPTSGSPRRRTVSSPCCGSR